MPRPASQAPPSGATPARSPAWRSAPTAGLLASSGRDKTVRVWDAATGREVRSFRGHTDSVKGVAYSPNSRLIASASLDRTVKVWDVTTGQEVRTFEGHG